jgi:arylsulfatase A-like enzyme
MSQPAARTALGATGVMIVLVAAFALVGGRPRSTTQCLKPSQVVALAESLDAAVACNDERLLDGPFGSCAPAPAPTCSRTLATDAVALAYGAAEVPPVAHDPDVLGAQFACQQAIGAGVAAYTASRLEHRIAGLSRDQADAAAAPLLDPLVAACNVSVGQDAGGVVLPAVGPQCAAAVGAPGSPVAAGELRACLRQLLNVWDERIGPDPTPLRPNIVFINTDDQRWDTTGPEHALPGQVAMPEVRSEIADVGVEFTQGFVTTPLCCPSRMSWFKSQYAHEHDIHQGTTEELAAVDDSSTIATWLQDAGYRTGMFGKYANGYGGLWTGGEPPYVPPGWDEWQALLGGPYYDYKLVENGVLVQYGSTAADYSTDVLRAKVVAFIADAAASGEPFFAYFAPVTPHYPWEPAPRHLSTRSGVAAHRPPSFNEADVSDKAYLSNAPLQEPVQIDYMVRRSMEMVLAVDEAVGEIAQLLRDLGIENDTLFVYTSDNGYYWGEHRLVAKNRPYEESVRVPYMIRYPRLAPLPRSDDRFVLNLDFAPTLVELAGATPAASFAGTSLVRAIDGTASAWRSDFLMEAWPTGTEFVTVREKRWKYIEYSSGRKELYDLDLDPYELTSVHSNAANAARIAAMAARARELRPTWPGDITP